MLNKISIFIFIPLCLVSTAQADSGQFIFSGSTPHALFGCSVSDAGDVNNDGYDDIIVGTCGHEKIGSYTDRDSTGVAYVISGHEGTVLYVLTGDNIGDMFGQIVGAAGDINDDGYDDVMVGAPQLYTPGVTERGYARVISGKDQTILANYYGSSPDSVLGNMLSNQNVDMTSAEVSLGDINSDGINDFAIVDKYADINGFNSGSIWIYSGADNAALYAFNDGIADHDRDSIPDLADNCPIKPNREQEDGDHDGMGDMCDFDKDNDGIDDIDDYFPRDPLIWAWLDVDIDTIEDHSDNCPGLENPDQIDTDGDGSGDPCDSTPNGDNDGDGIDNLSDILPDNPYQCSKAGLKYARKYKQVKSYKKVCRSFGLK